MNAEKKPIVFISSAFTSNASESTKMYEYFVMQVATLSISLNNHDYSIVLKVPRDQDSASVDQSRFLRSLLSEGLTDRYSGLIVSPFDKGELAGALAEVIIDGEPKGFPVVTIDKGFEHNAEKHELKAYLRGNDQYPPYVMVNEEIGGEEAAKGLFIALRDKTMVHRDKMNIAIVEGLGGSEARIKGFVREFNRLSSEVGCQAYIYPDTIKGKYSRTEARIRTLEFLKKTDLEVHGFFCCNDEMALGVRKAIEEVFSGCQQDLDGLKNGFLYGHDRRLKRNELMSKRSKLSQMKIIGFDGILEAKILISHDDMWLKGTVDVNVSQQTDVLVQMLIGMIENKSKDIQPTRVNPVLVSYNSAGVN